MTKRFVIPALLLLSCASSIQRRVDAPLALQIRAIAVYPFVFRWPEPPYRWFDLSIRLVAVTADTAPLALVFGPPEFRVYRSDDNNVWAASDLAARLPKYRISPEETVVLRPWAEKRQASLANEVSDASGRAKGTAAHHELTYIGHIEVVHPSTRHVIAEATGKVRVDLLSNRSDETDPAPELTQLMENLTAEVLKSLREHIHLPSLPKQLPLQTALVPPEVITSPDGQPVVETRKAPDDPLEHEVFQMARIRFSNPSLNERQVNQALKCSEGLFVVSSSVSQVNPGDVIQKIDGEAAFPQTLQRIRFAGTTVWLEIRRPDGAELTVPLN